MSAQKGTSNGGGTAPEKSNREQIEEHFEANYEELAQLPGTSFVSKCKLCPDGSPIQMVKERWMPYRSEGGSDIEKGKAKLLRNYTARQQHLSRHHPEEYAKLNLRHNKTHNRKTMPGNSNATTFSSSEMKSRSGPCFHCGQRFIFNALPMHRRQKSSDSKAGCSQFGVLYNNANRHSPELISAKSRTSATLTERETHRQKFLQFMDSRKETIPTTVEELGQQERKNGIYVQLETADIGGIRYGGRTESFSRRMNQHDQYRHFYTTRDTVIPGRITLHILTDLTLTEAKCAEYFLLQLVDPFTEHDSRLGNILVPYPWCPQSTSKDGEKVKEQNLAIHAVGRQLLADLLMDAIILHQQGLLDPVNWSGGAQEQEEAETPATGRKRFTRRKRPSAPDNLQLAPSSSASSSTAPTTPAIPTTSTPTLASELLELKHKLEESEQRNRELVEDNKNKEEQRKRYKRKTHEFSDQLNRLAERFNASVSPMTSPGSLPSQPPSQTAPLPPPCFD